MADGTTAARAMCRCVPCSQGDDCGRARARRYDAARDPMWRKPEGEAHRRRQEAIVAMLEEQ